MGDIFLSSTPVRSNLAQLLLKLKDLPSDVVADSLNKLVSSLVNTPVSALVSERNSDSVLSSDSEDTDSSFEATMYRSSSTSTSTSTAASDQIVDEPVTCNCKKSKCLKL